MLFASSLSRFRFFFCLLDKALEPVPDLGDPGVEESGVLEVRESRPEVELPEHLLEPVSSSSVDSSAVETWGPATMPETKIGQQIHLSDCFPTANTDSGGSHTARTLH